MKIPLLDQPPPNDWWANIPLGQLGPLDSSTAGIPAVKRNHQQHSSNPVERLPARHPHRQPPLLLPAYGSSSSNHHVPLLVYPPLSKNHNNYATADAAGDPLVLLGIDPSNGSSLPSPPYPGSGDSEMSQPSGLNVRAEEIGLVLLVLLLWAGAVALFFNRWGKIRMLEPYQPKFIDAPRGSLAVGTVGAQITSPLLISAAHRPSYPIIEFAHQPPTPLRSSFHQQQQQQQHHQSRLNVSMTNSNDGATSADPSSHQHHQHQNHWGNSNSSSSHCYINESCHYQRPRQNSVVVFATAHFLTAARRVKSAMDLQSMVLREETEESVHALGSTTKGSASHSDAITCV